MNNAAALLDLNHKKSNLEVIVDYLTSEKGAVILTPKQEEMLERLHYTDDLLRNQYSSKQVVNMLMKQFGYAASTAWRDIDDTRQIFGTTRKINKNYILAVHLERIEDQIAVAVENKDTRLLPFLFDCYTKAMKEIKDESKSAPPPTAIVFNIMQQVSELLPDDYTEADAKDAAKKRLADRGIPFDEADFEEI